MFPPPCKHCVLSWCQRVWFWFWLGWRWLTVICVPRGHNKGRVEVGKRANRWNSLHKTTTLQVNSCHRQLFAPDRPDIDPQVTSLRPEHRHNYIMHEEAIQTTHAASCQSVSTSEKNKSLFLRVCECICSRIHAFSTARSDVFHRLIFG